MRPSARLTLSVLLTSASVLAQSEPALSLAKLPPPSELTGLLWEHSPDLLVARGRLAQARGDVDRAHLIPNPGLDVSWNTVPLGPTNPAHGVDRWTNVPNYAFALSELLEIGKRGPRQRSVESAQQAAVLDAAELLRQRYFDLNERISEVATAELRVAALSDTAADAARLTEIQSQRQAHGDTAGLDVDRSRLEEAKLEANLGDEREKLEGTLLTCSQVAGVRCQPFSDRDLAFAFLAQRLSDGNVSPRAVDQRPDLRSLQAQTQSARAAVALAHAHAIPDPTVRVGYVWDQFIAAGNQNRSFFVGMSLPLPLFDHGQAEGRQATALAGAASAQREQLTRQANRDLDALDQQLGSALARRLKLRARTLPLAKDVVRRLDAAVRSGGAPLPDLLLARRTLYELLLDAADLDQFTFHLSITRSRTAGEIPPLVGTLAAARL